MKPFAHFFLNISKTVSASGVQFLLTLCTTPIMTRLYEPAAYATFGIINTLATVIVGVGLVSLPNAYCAEKDSETRRAMIHTMLLLLTGLALLAGVIALGMGLADSWSATIHVSRAALLLLPLLVITYGLRQILVNIAIQRANFTQLSIAQIVEPVCSRGGSIALGAAHGGHPAFILGAVLLGHLSAIGLLLKGLPRNLHRRWREVWSFRNEASATLRRFADFVFYNTAAQQAQPVIMLALQMGVAAFFSSELAGEYIFAVSILTLPVSLIALATAPVVYHHFIVTEKKTIPSFWRGITSASPCCIFWRGAASCCRCIFTVRKFSASPSVKTGVMPAESPGY